MLTIFTTPKPFTEDTTDRQCYAIRSWLQITPDVIVFGEEQDRDIIEELGARFIDDYKRNELGTPYVDSLFDRAQELAKYPTLMYVNADVILLPGVGDVVKAIEQYGNFFVMGQRIDIDLPNIIPGDANWVRHYQMCAAQSGRLIDQTGKDYFIVPNPVPFDIPSFLVGRLMWDTAFVRLAHEAGCTLFDATPSITALHIQHGYDHLPGGRTEYAQGPETKYNYSLVGQTKTINGHIYDAPHVINFDGRIINRDEFNMSQAYTASDVALKQRTMVDRQLAEMLAGNPPSHFDSLGKLLQQLRESTKSEHVTLLDAACSSAYYADIVQHYVSDWVEYTGYDFNPGMVALARNLHPEFSTLWGDVRNMGMFQDRIFDIVLSGATIMHIKDWQIAIKELARVADKWLILHRTWVYPNHTPTQIQVRDGYGHNTWYITFNEKELVDLVRVCGFVQKQSIPSGESSGANWTNLTYLFERE